MKQKHLYLLLGVMVSLLMAATPQWIQYNERLVGESSPDYPDDVINRPAKEIWTNFLVEHDDTGAHTTMPITSEYAITGNGTGAIASWTGSNTYSIQFTTYYSITATVNFKLDGVQQSIWKHKNADTQAVLLDFGRDASNKLYLTVNGTTVTDTAAIQKDHPQQVTVAYTFSTGKVNFIRAGGHAAEATMSPVPSVPSFTNETLVMGDGLTGDILQLSSSNKQRIIATTTTFWVPAIPESFSAHYPCYWFYDMDNNGGTTITDRKAMFSGLSPKDLTIVNGTWTEYPNGY